MSKDLKIRPWRTWYGQYLASGELSEEFVRELFKVFSIVSGHYWSCLSSAFRTKREDTAKGHSDVHDMLEDAAQEVVSAVVMHIKKSFALRGYYLKQGEEEWRDDNFGRYFFTMVENECTNYCHSSDWWSIHDRLASLSTLALLDERNSIYVPATWVQRLPSHQLEPLLKSVPVLDELRGDTFEELRKAVDHIFAWVNAPIPITELASVVVNILLKAAQGREATYSIDLLTIQDRLHELGTLTLLEECDQFYVPSRWWKALQPHELDPLLESVPPLHKLMNEHLSSKKLQQAIDHIFAWIGAPISLNELTTAVMKVFHASPIEVSIEKRAKDAQGHETENTQMIFEPPEPTSPEDLVEEVSVSEWLRSKFRSNDVTAEHLLVLKYTTCFDKLSPAIEKLTLGQTAQCVRRILGIESFEKSTAHNRLEDVKDLLRHIPQDPGGEVRIRKYRNPYLPKTSEQAVAFKLLLCERLHERLAEEDYTKIMLDGIGEEEVGRTHVSA